MRINTLFQSIATVSGLTLASRVVGFFRTMLMASLVGSGAMADALVIAIKIPSVMRRIFAEGAFNAAFVPILTGLIASKGPEEARRFANQVLSLLILVLSVLVLLVELFMPSFLNVVVSGFDTSTTRFAYAVTFTRITFPFILFISICAFFSGILNSLERFAFAASSPLIGNFGIIATVLCLESWAANAGVAFSYGIAVCGIIQAMWVLVPAARAGFLPKLSIITFTGPVRDFFALLLPAAFGAGVVQINIFLDMIIASHLPIGGIAFLEYADRLNQLPLSTIGVAMGTVLLPTIARQLRRGGLREANKTQNKALEYAILFAVPAMLGLLCLANPITEVVYAHGKMTREATFEVARTLQAFSLGLPAFILIKVTTSIFYAHKDTRTPVIIGTTATCVNLVLSIVLMQFYQHVGIALATALAAWLNVGALIVVLKMRERINFSTGLYVFLSRMVAVGVILFCALIVMRTYVWPSFSDSRVAQIVTLITFVALGLVIFFATAIACRVIKLRDLRDKTFLQ